MDSVLREMSLNLNSFKEELTAPKPQQTGISAPAQPSVSAAASADPVLAAAYAVRETPSPAAYPARISYPAPQSAAEPEDLKLEVANLKGQLTAMQGELGRLSMQRGVQMRKIPFRINLYPRPRSPCISQIHTVTLRPFPRRRLFADPRSERSRCARVCERG